MQFLVDGSLNTIATALPPSIRNIMLFVYRPRKFHYLRETNLVHLLDLLLEERERWRNWKVLKVRAHPLFHLPRTIVPG